MVVVLYHLHFGMEIVIETAKMRNTDYYIECRMEKMLVLISIGITSRLYAHFKNEIV